MLRHCQSEAQLSRASSMLSDRGVVRAAEPRLVTALMKSLDQHVGVTCTDATGDITFVNEAFCRISGYTPTELLGHNHRLLRADHHPRDFFAELWRTIARGEVWRGEITNRAKDGSEYWVIAIVAPIADGALLGASYVALYTDITQQKRQALAELERSRTELARCHEELQQYAYVASHDLQEPLRAIVGCGQLLRQEYAEATSDATARQLLDHMIDGGQRLQQLVLALLAYSRVASCSWRRVPSSAQSALQQAIERLDASIQASAATIEAHDLPTVSCDPQQLILLFQNLLENAIKYRAVAPPVIRISAELDGDHWRFSVADNGIGIERQYSERVFVLFQRLHARGKYPGSGVGLTICRKIVEQHGGKIWVESEKTRGTTFHFTLPTPESTNLAKA
jgi:two-component system, chemotaxis family, sensor kinase Cph1